MKEQAVNEETARLDAIAWRLITCEGGDSADPKRVVDAADIVCRKLRERLVVVIGRGGFAAILEHAVKLTRARFPFLLVDPAAQDGPCLKGLPESVHGEDASELSAIVTTLIANILVTLVDLVGRDLSYTFLRAIWPDIEIDT